MTVSVQISVFYGSEAVKAKLNQLSIQYMEGRTCLVFEVNKGTQEYLEMRELLNREASDPARNRLFRISYLYTPHYSTAELMQANYLFVRSTYDCIRPDNEDEIFKGRCYLGEKKVDYLGTPGRSCQAYQHNEYEGTAIVARKPNWRTKRCFASGCSQLFCNDRAKEIIEDNKLTGVHFERVLNKTMQPYEDFWLLAPQTVEGFLAPGLNERVRRCPICGVELFEHITGVWTIRVDESKLTPPLDFFRPPAVLLTASGVGFSRTIISQRAYRVLNKAKIIQALIFDPIQS